MSGGGGRSSREMSTNPPETGLRFAASTHSEVMAPVTPSTSGQGRGAMLSGNKSMAQLGVDKPVSTTRLDANNGCCNNCSGYLDDCNRNMLKFVTSSKMLDFIFERDNLCNKSEECLKLEREAEGWGNIADTTVGAVGSAVSLAVDFLLGDDKTNEYFNGQCPDRQGPPLDSRCVGSDYKPKGGPQQGTNSCKSFVKSNTDICPNISSVRMIHENGESVSNSQADLICDHTMTNLDLLNRLEKISNLCKMLPASDLCGESQHQLRSNDAPVSMPMPCRSKSVHQNISMTNPSDEPVKSPGRRRSLCRQFGPESSPSQGEGVGEPPSKTLVQELVPETIVNLPPSCRPSQQGQSLQSVPSNTLAEAVGPPNQPSNVGTPKGSSNQFIESTPCVPSTRNQDTNTTIETPDKNKPISNCPSAEVQTSSPENDAVVPPQESKSNITPRPCSSSVGTQRSEPEVTKSVCGPAPISWPGPSLNDDQPPRFRSGPISPQDNKSTNTTVPSNDATTQECGPPNSTKSESVMSSVGTDPVTNPNSCTETGGPPQTKLNLNESTPQVTKDVKGSRGQPDLKCVVTEVFNGTDTVTTLEINGQTINVPNNPNAKGLWLKELRKLNDAGSVLKHNLEEVKNIKDKSAGQGRSGTRMKGLQQTSPESVTNINITEEEYFPGEKEGKKTVKNIACKLHDFRASDSQNSIKGLEVEGQILDPEEEPDLEMYIKKLEEIEATLEEIAVDFKDMIKSVEDPSDKEKVKIASKEQLPDNSEKKQGETSVSKNSKNKEQSAGSLEKKQEDTGDKEVSSKNKDQLDGSSDKKQDKTENSFKDSSSKSKERIADGSMKQQDDTDRKKSSIKSKEQLSGNPAKKDDDTVTNSSDKNSSMKKLDYVATKESTDKTKDQLAADTKQDDPGNASKDSSDKTKDQSTSSSDTKQDDPSNNPKDSSDKAKDQLAGSPDIAQDNPGNGSKYSSDKSKKPLAGSPGKDKQDKKDKP